MNELFGFVVTAGGMMPISASMAKYVAVSASSISGGGDTVPPGCRFSSSIFCRMVTGRSPTWSTFTETRVNSVFQKPLKLSGVQVGHAVPLPAPPAEAEPRGLTPSGTLRAAPG